MADSHTAVDELSLTVRRQTVYGFIGPNGSGKTTTLRMIMRMILPNRGHVRVRGEEKFEAASDRLAYLPEKRGLYRSMKVRDILRFYAEPKGFRDCQKAIDLWLERMGLADWDHRKIEALSKGMAQKVQFIATVIVQPELILLDEPFTGLNPVNTDVLREAILDPRRQSSIIIFSTHDMAVAEKMCDFIFMISRGRKVLDSTLASIQGAFGNDTVRVHLEGRNGLHPVELEDLPGVLKVTDFGRWQELRLGPGTDTQDLLGR